MVAFYAMTTEGTDRRQITDEMLKRIGLTRERFDKMQVDRVRREAIAPKVGEQAPDFNLPLLANREQTVRLSDFRGRKPVVLIFGSYT